MPMTNPTAPPFGIPDQLTLSIGICSPGAVGPNGFTFDQINRGGPYGNIAAGVNSGSAFLVSGPAYWSGKSWNTLWRFGTRKTNPPPQYPLFPDLPDLQRILVGLCLWYTGDHFAMGVQISQRDYEAEDEQSGIVYLNMDIAQPSAPRVIPFPSSFTTQPPIRTFDRGFVNGLFWQPNDVGSFTHGNADDTARDLNGVVDGQANWKSPFWIPFPGFPAFTLVNPPYNIFAKVQLGSNSLCIFQLFVA